MCDFKLMNTQNWFRKCEVCFTYGIKEAASRQALFLVPSISISGSGGCEVAWAT